VKGWERASAFLFCPERGGKNSSFPIYYTEECRGLSKKKGEKRHLPYHVFRGFRQEGEGLLVLFSSQEKKKSPSAEPWRGRKGRERRDPLSMRWRSPNSNPKHHQIGGKEGRDDQLRSKEPKT